MHAFLLQQLWRTHMPKCRASISSPPSRAPRQAFWPGRSLSYTLGSASAPQSVIASMESECTGQSCSRSAPGHDVPASLAPYQCRVPPINHWTHAACRRLVSQLLALRVRRPFPCLHLQRAGLAFGFRQDARTLWPVDFLCTAPLYWLWPAPRHASATVERLCMLSLLCMSTALKLVPRGPKSHLMCLLPVWFRHGVPSVPGTCVS